jgi:hypothetical protein
MNYVLDFDDFSVLNNRLDLLLRLKEAYPKLKVSLFTIPYDAAYEFDVSAKIMRDKTLEEIHKHLDWMEIIPHGLTHFAREFEKCDYATMKEVMKAIDVQFKKDGLPYQKGFKAPYWLWNKDVVKCLDDEGWWGAIDMINNKEPIPKRYYRFNHSIDSPFSKSRGFDLMKLHGHITGNSKNSIDRCFTNLFKMDTDAEFKFASECLEEYEDNSMGE